MAEKIKLPVGSDDFKRIREENRALFAGTYIEQAGEQYMQEQGQWPVVLLAHG